MPGTWPVVWPREHEHGRPSLGSSSFCLEINDITSTHISLAGVSHVTTPASACRNLSMNFTDLSVENGPTVSFPAVQATLGSNCALGSWIYQGAKSNTFPLSSTAQCLILTFPFIHSPVGSPWRWAVDLRRWEKPSNNRVLQRHSEFLKEVQACVSPAHRGAAEQTLGA